jgi:hypothetical protein
MQFFWRDDHLWIRVRDGGPERDRPEVDINLSEHIASLLTGARMRTMSYDELNRLTGPRPSGGA